MRSIGKSVKRFFGRMQVLTRRQKFALAIVVVLGVAIGTAAAMSNPSLAVALVGLLGMVLFATLLQTHRRLTQEIRSVALESIRLAERVEVAQRRLIAAVENERLEAADRQWKSDERVVAELRGSLKTAMAGLSRQQVRYLWDHTRATDALLQLYRGLDNHAPMPPSAAWAPLGPLPGAAATADGHPWIFVVPHPDDETLGAGVSIAEHVAAGFDVHVLLLTRGTTAVVLDQLNGNTATGPWWGGITHDPAAEGYKPLTEAEFGLARCGEFVAALGALGVKSDRIHEADLNSQAVTIKEVKAAIVATADKVGREIGLWAPSYIVDNHGDHLAAGNAVRELCAEEPERFRRHRFYVLPAYWTDSRLSDVDETWDLPTDVAIAARVRNACKAYSAWQPASGAYAIGYHSVPSMFAQIDTGPRVMYHS